ncbi:LAMI_0E12684g1_1 [Lachancea mirantina]|uniref:Sphingoid long-chain base transporter RSB1 n=1 Tax=Lachancea mirantina TaxID=1230905 RepID=A0A1G4JQG0_9SACH|nr:LAMI_0E12684g1_1 [Lachancea mirantina]
MLSIRDHIPQSEIPANLSMYSGMVPNFRFNVTMAAIFGLLWIFQLGAGVYTRQYWICIAFICACGLEVAGYTGRALSSNDVQNVNYFLLQFICLTIAPVFTMGGVYYQLAKLIEIYGHSFALLSSPMAYSYIFMGCDIISLVVQAVGGGMSGTAAANYESSATGDHIFVAGLAFQVFTMTAFLFLWFHFCYLIYIKARERHVGAQKFSRNLLQITQTEIDYLYRPKFEFLRQPERWVFKYFPLALTATVIFVYVRCIYRVIELAEGWSGYLITHEWYFIILDALMISAATLALSIFHPGFAFKGKSVGIKITSRKKAAMLESAPSESTPWEHDSTSSSGEMQELNKYSSQV